MVKRRIGAFFHPERFQGWGKSRRYFEGWYFKVVTADESKAFAFIPGVAMDERGERSAFVQVLDGRRVTSLNHRFAFESFRPMADRFEIAIAGSRFSEHSMELQLPGAAGVLRFTGTVPWPNHWYSPGIMGPYAFVPFMECYHGVVSMDHGIDGALVIDGEKIDFAGGRGYIEKDWGTSFPSAYVWVQTNHFSEPGVSLKASIARIPWIRNAFVGFIAGLWLGDRLIQFTTYNRSRLAGLTIGTERVEFALESRQYQLRVSTDREAAAQLASPIRGLMDGRIEESMTSRVRVLLTDRRSGRTVFEDEGRNAGLEVAGDVGQLLIPTSAGSRS